MEMPDGGSRPWGQAAGAGGEGEGAVQGLRHNNAVPRKMINISTMSWRCWTAEAGGGAGRENRPRGRAAGAGGEGAAQGLRHNNAATR